MDLSDREEFSDEQLCRIVHDNVKMEVNPPLRMVAVQAKEAFEELYRRTFPGLGRMVWLLFGFDKRAEQEVEFIANGIMARLYVAIIAGQYDFDRSLKPYLDEAIRNAVCDWARAGKKSWMAIDDDVPTDASEMPISQLLAEERQKMVWRVLAKLREDYRDVLVLRYIEGFSYEKIEQRLGMTNGVLRGLLQRARDEFKRQSSGIFEQ